MPRPFATLALSTFVLLAGPAAPLRAQCPATSTRYVVTDLGALGGARSSALDINDAGAVIGVAELAPDPVSGVVDLHPFRWERGAMTDLGTLGGPFGSAGGINASGQVAGQADDAFGSRRAFLHTATGMTELPTLGGFDGRGFDLNDAGQVVGISSIGGYQRAFLYDPATDVVTDLGTFDGDNAAYANAINNAGQVAGWSGPSNNVVANRAYLLDRGVRTPLGTLGGTRSVAFDLDEAGRVVGWSDLPGDESYHAFLWADGSIQGLGTLGGDFSTAAGAHASGTVVGWSTAVPGPPPPATPRRAFVYANGLMADLNALVAPASGLALEYAAAVNGRGQIVGWGRKGAIDSRAFLATPAAAAVGDLLELVRSFRLPPGISASLRALLRAALSFVDRCNTGGACALLRAFVLEVRALAGRQIPRDQADQLLASAAALRAALGCP